MQIIVNILVLTCIYALIASGYVLIYKVSRVLNFAHGELMVLGAYLLLAMASAVPIDPLWSIAFAVAFSGLIGALLYLLLMRNMTGQPILSAILVTVALGILIRGIIALIWSPQTFNLALAAQIPFRSVPVFADASISLVALALVIATILSYAGLFAFMRFSRWGMRMRAVGQNPLLAAQRGIQLHAVYAIAWSLATFTGSMAGILVAADRRLEISLAVLGLKAFPAALVGGMDSLYGAVIGALVVAASEVLLIHYVDPLLSDVVPFFILIAMFAVRPWGLFGTRENLDRV